MPVIRRLSQSAQAAVTKYLTWGSLTNRHLFSHCSGGWKVQDEDSDRVHFLMRALFLAYPWPPSPCPHMVERTGAHRRLLLFLRTPLLWIRAPPLRPHLALITSLKAYVQYSHREIRVSTNEFRGTHPFYSRCSFLCFPNHKS